MCLVLMFSYVLSRWSSSDSSCWRRRERSPHSNESSNARNVSMLRPMALLLAGRLGDVGLRGKNLHSELDRAGRSKSRSDASASYITPRLVYDSPAKNLRAAEANASELSGLTGEERLR